MNSQTRSLMRPMTILVPLILIVALFGSYLRAELFYRMAYHDGMSFYCRHIRATITEYGGRYASTGQNDNFIADTMYYPLLEAGGFNLPQTGAPWDWLDGQHEYLWGNLKVYQSNLGEVGRYSAAQYKDYGVGTDIVNDYFRHPLIGVVGVDPDGFPFEEIIFYCDMDSCNAGYVIDTKFWKWDQCMDHRLYHVEMKLKVRNPVSMDSNFIRLEFGTDDEADLPPESLFPHEYFGIGVYPSDPSGTDDVKQFFLTPGQLSGIGEYVTWCFSDSFSLRQKQTVFRLYWYDTADLYLDWIRVYDQKYYDFVLERSIHLGLAMEK